MTVLVRLALAAALTVAQVTAIVRERAAAHGVDGAALVALVMCESDGDVFAIGRQGELGLAQLSPTGLLPRFYQLGYSDPWSAWQQTDFLARMVATGEGRQWSCWWTEIIGRNPPWWD